MFDRKMTGQTPQGLTGRLFNGLRQASFGASFGALLMASVAMQAGTAFAGPFDAVIGVNDRVVTRYEMEQRLLFLQILRQPGDLPKMARDGLIEDRLRLAAADALGLKAGPDQIAAGMAEFAGRANLSTEEFLKATGEMGLDAESFRDFVEAGILWRDVVRAKFADTVSITEAEIDRAIAQYEPTSALQLDLLALEIPGEGVGLSGAQAQARRLQSQITSEEDFTAAARATATTTMQRLGWKRLSELPANARPALARLAPASLSRPVEVDGKLVLYWLRERGEAPLGKDAGVWLDHAEFLLPEGPGVEAEAAAIRARVDDCDDLYTVAKGLPAERLTRETQPQAAVPSDLAAVLATLDAGETAARLSRNGWRVFQMLCSRGPAPDLVPDRDTIREQLLNQRLSALADIYLEELRSEAIITDTP